MELNIMELTESQEMYLETIYILHLEKGLVRSTDVAEEMNYSKASVSRGVGILRDTGFVTMEEDGNLSLTEKGEAIARGVYEKHVVLSRFLQEMGVDKNTAAKDACRIEHVIHEETFLKIKDYLGKLYG